MGEEKVFICFYLFLFVFSSSAEGVSLKLFLRRTDVKFQQFSKIGSNNTYWIKLSSIIGNYCPKNQAACGEKKRHHCIREFCVVTYHSKCSQRALGVNKKGRGACVSVPPLGMLVFVAPLHAGFLCRSSSDGGSLIRQSPTSHYTQPFYHYIFNFYIFNFRKS